MNIPNIKRYLRGLAKRGILADPSKAYEVRQRKGTSIYIDTVVSQEVRSLISLLALELHWDADSFLPDTALPESAARAGTLLPKTAAEDQIKKHAYELSILIAFAQELIEPLEGEESAKQ